MGGRSRDDGVKAHHYCGLLVLAGVMLWLVVRIVAGVVQVIGG
ncbi:MAG TPA: hypothetical protein VIG90_15545 [Pedomonas sp.]